MAVGAAYPHFPKPTGGFRGTIPERPLPVDAGPTLHVPTVGMNTAPDLSLYDALLMSGRLSAEQRAEAERLFGQHAADPPRLADELLAAKLITRYMHRKIAGNRAGELVFGQYLILERIGEGGMGKVYRAIETRLGREVALKTIRPNLLANRTVVQRYKREARAAASLPGGRGTRAGDWGGGSSIGTSRGAAGWRRGVDVPGRTVVANGPTPFDGPSMVVSWASAVPAEPSTMAMAAAAAPATGTVIDLGFRRRARGGPESPRPLPRSGPASIAVFCVPTAARVDRWALSKMRLIPRIGRDANATDSWEHEPLRRGVRLIPGLSPSRRGPCIPAPPGPSGATIP